MHFAELIIFHHLDVTTQFSLLCENHFGSVDKKFAICGEVSAPLGSIEKRNAELTLEALDAPAERRLAQMHRICRSGEIDRFSQRDDVLEAT